MLDSTEVLQQVRDRYVGDPAFSNLPRKFKTSISGCSAHCTNHEINDVAFVGVELPDGTKGYDLWVGGGLSTNPKLGLRLGAFVEPDRVAEVWAGVCAVFRDYGYRRSRMHARLKFLLADWGPEKFRQVLETEYLTAPLPDGPAPSASPVEGRDHVGVHRQRDGRSYVGAVPRAGRTSGSQLTRVAALAERYGDGRIATTAQQGLVASRRARRAPRHPRRRARVRGPAGAPLPLPPRHPGLHRPGVLQARDRRDQGPLGRPLHRAREAPARLRRADHPERQRLPELVRPFPDRGHRPQGLHRRRVEGFQVHLGGRLGEDAGFGRKSRGLKVTADDAPDYVERLLRRYLEHREPGERFAVWARRADEALLT